jgi:hypothetical protein
LPAVISTSICLRSSDGKRLVSTSSCRIATFAGILAQTQAAEFTLHILRGRCAARPDRSPFLADEAAALRGQAIGNGALFRVIREVQERYFRPPELIPGGSGKYGR